MKSFVGEDLQRKVLHGTDGEFELFKFFFFGGGGSWIHVYLYSSSVSSDNVLIQSLFGENFKAVFASLGTIYRSHSTLFSKFAETHFRTVSFTQ